MSAKWKNLLVASSVTLCLGAVLGYLLFYYSDKFFDIKTLQTEVSGGFSGAQQSRKGSEVLPKGAIAPEVKGVDLRSGEETSLDSFSNKIIILNFWASWCEPCLDEFPSFASLLKKFQSDFVFIGVSQDSAVDDAESFLKAFEAELADAKAYFIHDDKKTFAQAYGVLALPETFILGPDRKLIHRVSGFEDWSSPGAIKFFNKIKDEYLSGKKGAHL